MALESVDTHSPKAIETPSTIGTVVVRFAGDSGDGIQVLGGEFAKSSAFAGHDIMTFPDFPAEIRAPVGTTFGVSAYQIQFGGPKVRTPGDKADVLIAFNPAALKTNLYAAKPNALIIIDEGSFNKRNLQKAGYETNPMEDGSLNNFRVLPIDITTYTEEAVKESGVGKKQSGRAKNFWALGLIYWIFGRDRAPTIKWIEQKFGTKAPEAVSANCMALNAGHAFGETIEIGPDIAARAAPSGETHTDSRAITGTDAMALGLAAVSTCSGLQLTYCTYPITPASALLHALAKLKGKGVVTYQAEDEISAATAAIGASYAGSLGITASSGPGIALKGESLGLAVATELPLIVIDVQRAGPSTGMPTKAEQTDLNIAAYGRHGEAPCPILAPAKPAECFDIMLEAARLATTYMTPVFVMSDAYLANAAEPWQAPDVSKLPDLTPAFITENFEGFHPFIRNKETLARPWVKPGTEGLEHRIGGLEKDENSGHISYDPENHQRMTELRAQKINKIATDGYQAEIEVGPQDGDVAILGWGSTHGALKTAVEQLNTDGHKVAHIHLRQVIPLPQNLEALLRQYEKVIVAEINSGQLRSLIRSEYLIPAEGLNKVTGQPFHIDEVKNALLKHLNH